jgi:hypothetical protein
MTTIGVQFSDGTSGRFNVKGDEFHPEMWEKFLFEFPDGTLKEGQINDVGGEATEGARVQDGIFSVDARTIAVEV